MKILDRQNSNAIRWKTRNKEIDKLTRQRNFSSTVKIGDIVSINVLPEDKSSGWKSLNLMGIVFKVFKNGGSIQVVTKHGIIAKNKGTKFQKDLFVTSDKYKIPDDLMPLEKTLSCYLKHIKSKTFDTKNIVRISFGELYKKEYGVPKKKKNPTNVKSNSSPLTKIISKRKDRDNSIEKVHISEENAVEQTSVDSFDIAMKKARQSFNDELKAARALKFVASDSSSENVFNQKTITNEKIVEKVVQPSQCMIDLKKCMEEDNSIDDKKHTYKEAFIQRKSKRLKAMYAKSKNDIEVDSNQSLNDALKIREQESESDTSSPIHVDDIVSLSLNGHAPTIAPHPTIVDINNQKDSDSVLTTSIDGDNVI
jgi:hypothetical protein